MEKPHLVPTSALTAAGARAILDAAQAEAVAIGVPQCLAVVDAGGRLLAFVRMDGARPASAEIAISKAVSAALRYRPTADEAGGEAAGGARLSLASGGLVTNIGGGFPIVVDGRTIGGIGASSGTVAEDSRCAEAGLAALRELATLEAE
ncbi:MAG: heme-binding protein [Candidatus Velthaea sp.]|jgi:uncharacterized protein GlcG (DUF336 family)